MINVAGADPMMIVELSVMLAVICLPFTYLPILLAAGDRSLMGDYVNTVTFNIVAWVTAIAMITLTLVLTYTALFQQSVPSPP